ncbi:MAG: MaoC family dehydratase [Candidimonas sp.]|jgi:hypothetical protein
MSLPIDDLQPGDIRCSKFRKLTMARALALSGGPLDMPGWPDKNLHTDAEVARSTGLPDVVVSGTQWEGHLVGLLVETLGMDWFNGGSIQIKIPRSVRIGDSVRAKLRMDEFVDQGDRRLARMTVWCENKQGQEVMVGTAECAVSRAARGHDKVEQIESA